MADLLVMSSVDQKAPAEIPGSAALLDALVKEHLQLDDGGAPQFDDNSLVPVELDDNTPPDLVDALTGAPAKPAPDSSVVGPPLTHEERVRMLQSEIETLLRDAPDEAPGACGTDVALPVPLPMAMSEAPPLAAPEAPADTVRAAPSAVSSDVAVPIESPVPLAASDTTPIQLTRPLVTDMPNISRQELDALLAQGAALTPGEALAANGGGGPIPLPAPSPGMPETSLVTPAQTEEELSEAEGVLAEELAKLIADATPPEAVPPAAAPPAASAAPALLEATEGVPSGEISGLMDSPAPAAGPAPSAAPPLAAPSAPASQPRAAVAPVAAPPVCIPAAAEPLAAPQPELDAAPEPPESLPAAPLAERAPPRPGLAQKFQRLLTGLTLSIAQLLDLPFGWLDDLSRNIVGMAAFLLLLGGALLYVIARLTSSGGS